MFTLLEKIKVLENMVITWKYIQKIKILINLLSNDKFGVSITLVIISFIIQNPNTKVNLILPKHYTE